MKNLRVSVKIDVAQENQYGSADVVAREVGESAGEFDLADVPAIVRDLSLAVTKKAVAAVDSRRLLEEERALAKDEA